MPSSRRELAGLRIGVLRISIYLKLDPIMAVRRSDLHPQSIPTLMQVMPSVLNLLNLMVFRFTKEGQVHHFLLDTGSPISFSTRLTHLTHEDLGFDTPFRHTLHPALIQLDDASRMLGVPITGFVGMDLVKQFDTFLIDARSRRIAPNVDPDGFNAEWDVPIAPGGFILGKASLSGGPLEQVAYDTGAMCTIVLDPNLPQGLPQSEVWTVPTMYGVLPSRLYNGLDVRLENGPAWPSVVGHPQGFPNPGFRAIIGLDILSNYACLYDMRGRRLLLRESDKEPVFEMNAPFTLGIKAEFDGEGLVATHVFGGMSEHHPRVGDRIAVKGIDHTEPEAVNRITSALTLLKTDTPVEVIVNEEIRILSPVPGFS